MIAALDLVGQMAPLRVRLDRNVDRQSRAIKTLPLSGRASRHMPWHCIVKPVAHSAAGCGPRL